MTNNLDADHNISRTAIGIDSVGRERRKRRPHSRKLALGRRPQSFLIFEQDFCNRRTKQLLHLGVVHLCCDWRALWYDTRSGSPSFL